MCRTSEISKCEKPPTEDLFSSLDNPGCGCKVRWIRRDLNLGLISLAFVCYGPILDGSVPLYVVAHSTGTI